MLATIPWIRKWIKWKVGRGDLVRLGSFPISGVTAFHPFSSDLSFQLNV